MSDRGPRILIAGAGSIGRRHLSNLSEIGQQEIVVAEPDEEKRAKLSAECAIPTTKTVKDAFERWDIDVTLVCTPTHLHVPVAQQAVEEGSHLFIEKPLSHSRKGLRTLLRAANSQDLITLVGCNLLFHPAIQKAEEIISSGKLGFVRTGRIHAGQYLPDWHPEEDHREMYSARKESGGVILDFIHEIGYARALLGKVHRVACMSGHAPSLEIEAETHASMMLDFEEGPEIAVQFDYLHRGYDRGFHLVLDEGTVAWSWDEPLKVHRGSGQEPELYPVTSDWTTNDMYLDEMRHFLSCVESDRSTRLPLVEGWRDLEVALAAKRSAEEDSFIEPEPVPETV